MRKFFKLFLALGLIFGLYSCSNGTSQPESIMAEFRAPAYPLISIDPYTSIWSNTDKLVDAPTQHWTGKNNSLVGSIRVDGKTYRFMGKEDIPLEPIVEDMKSEIPWNAKYTNTKPSGNWMDSTYNDDKWTDGIGAFGTKDWADAVTVWDTPEIWVRRTFVCPEPEQGKKLYLKYSHDDDMVLYINGKEIVNTGNTAKTNIIKEIDPALLKVGKENTIAAYCLDRGGAAYIDFGIFTDNDRKQVFETEAVQKSVKMSATKTQYEFTCGPIDLTLSFVAPLVLEDLDLMSRPVNYINYKVASNDGSDHDVQLYFDASPTIGVNLMGQEVQITEGSTGEVKYLKSGTVDQPVLERAGDLVTIDWGNLYLASGNDKNASLAINNHIEAKKQFKESGSVTNQGATKSLPLESVISCTEDLGSVSKKAQTGFVMLAYDDIESIQYFGDNLKAWWAKDGETTIEDVLNIAASEYSSVMQKCADVDNRVWNDAYTAGGNKYANLCILAYRQSIAAHKLVEDKEGNLLFFSKENNSNGSIGTVDITYPTAPLFLKYNPDLVKGMMNPIFYYSESGKWKKPFAAHDVGTYPKANGQTYGGDMPIEESGNMIITTAAVAQQEGNASYAEKHWDVLTVWADYLVEYGLDPENQLCTDDFAGHFAHNVNLSAKAIMAIASYGKLAKMLEKDDIAAKYTDIAKDYAQKWQDMAIDGDHYKLTFDKPGTWSQKYNLVWDRLLDLNIFPKEVIETETKYYLSKLNKYGLPLDNRRTYTKSDWVVWTATMSNDPVAFEKIIDPLYQYVLDTDSRVPMCDWYETTDASQVGFKARSVVGGYYIGMLKPSKFNKKADAESSDK